MKNSVQHIIVDYLTKLIKDEKDYIKEQKGAFLLEVFSGT